MIYQLVKRGYSWRLAMGAGALAVIAGSFGFLTTGAANGIGDFYFCLLALFLGGGKQRTIFEATLPIRPRDIIYARIISWTTLIWFPALPIAAFLASGAAANRWMVATAIEIAAVLTLAAIAAESARLRGLTVVGWRPAIVITGVIGIVFVLNQDPSALVVFAICAAASAVLLVGIRRWAPVTFEISGRKPAFERRAGGSLLPSFTWLPAVRTLFSSGSIYLVCASTFIAARGAWFFAIVFFFMEIASVMPPKKWIYSLPVSRARVFLGVVIPRLGPVLLGACYFLWSTWQPERTAVVALAATASAALLLLLWLQTVFLASRRGLSGIYRMVFMPLVVLLLYEVWPRAGRRAAQLRIAAWVAAALPGNLAVLIAASVVMVGGLGWVSYKVFCRMEPRRVRVWGKAGGG